MNSEPSKPDNLFETPTRYDGSFNPMDSEGGWEDMAAIAPDYDFSKFDQWMAWIKLPTLIAPCDMANEE